MARTRAPSSIACTDREAARSLSESRTESSAATVITVSRTMIVIATNSSMSVKPRVRLVWEVGGF